MHIPQNFIFAHTLYAPHIHPKISKQKRNSSVIDEWGKSSSIFVFTWFNIRLVFVGIHGLLRKLLCSIYQKACLLLVLLRVIDRFRSIFSFQILRINPNFIRLRVLFVGWIWLWMIYPTCLWLERSVKNELLTEVYPSNMHSEGGTDWAQPMQIRKLYNKVYNIQFLFYFSFCGSFYVENYY